MKSWLVALRIARREASRAKGRTLLVVAMIAMPVLALSFAAATYDSMKVSKAEQHVRAFGSATGTLGFSPPDSSENVKPPTTADLQTKGPAGVRVSPTFSDYVVMRTATGVGTLNAYGIDTTDPMTKGLVRTIRGRTPTADDEVAVSESALSRFGVTIGGTVTVYAQQNDPSFPLHTYKVVGIVEISGQIEQDVLFRPSQQPFTTLWYYSSPTALTPNQAAVLQALDVAADGRSPMVISDSVRALNVFGIGTIITGLGILEVVLLAGPAFAVGAKRRQRDLALASANGAAPSTIRRIVLADGVVAGVLAAVGGIALGLIGSVASRDLVEQHLTHQRGGGFQVSVVSALLIAGIAVVTGVLGALVPAYTVGKQDVIEALSGRRGVTKSRPLWLVLGICGVALASVTAFLGARGHSSNLVLTGLIIGELGLVLCTPSLVGLVARLGKVLPLTPRIALRDTARRRAAAAPAISAVMAAVAGSVALTVYLSANDARSSAYVQTRPTGSIAVYYDAKDGSGKTVVDAHQTVVNTLQRNIPGAILSDVAMPDCNCNVQPVLPDNLRCPYENDQPLSTDDQRRARADKRCDDPYGNSLSLWGVSNGNDAAAVVLGLSGRQLSTVSAALDGGRVVATDPRYVDSSGNIKLLINYYSDDGSNPPQARTVQLPATAATGSTLHTALLPASLAGTIGVKFTPFAVVAAPPSQLDQKQVDSLNGALLTAGLNQAQIEDGPPAKNNSIALILALAAGIIALGAAAIATGLAAADSRSDLMTLGAVGASPRVRRQLSLAQSGVIALLGSLLGVVAGFGAAAAVLTGLNRVWASGWPAPAPYPIEVPWLNLAVSLLIVPLVAMVGAGLLTRSRLPSERRAD